eukprot:195581-Rhodomonas_salina.2
MTLRYPEHERHTKRGGIPNENRAKCALPGPEAEVRELESDAGALAREEAVAGLEVLVADAVAVEVLEAPNHVAREPANGGLVERAEGRDELREAPAVAELHHQVRLLLQRHLLDEPDDVRVL